MKVEQVEHAVEELDQLILRRFGTVKPAQKATNVTNPREDNTHSDFSHLRWCLVNISEFMDRGKTEKAMRWLGFVQGALWMTGLASVDELKDMNKPEPKYYQEPNQELSLIEAMRFIKAVQNHMYVVDDKGTIDPDKDVNGGNLVEMLAARLYQFGLTPQVDDEPRKAEEPAPRGSKDWASAQEAAAKRISELESANEYLRKQLTDSINLQDECARLKLSARGFETSLKMCQREREGFESQTLTLRNECDRLEKKLVAALNELKLERLGHEGARKRLEVELNKKPAKRRKKR